MPKKTTKKLNLKNIVDIRGDKVGWLYSDTVKDHFFKPRNFMRYGEEKKFKFNAIGRVGSPACGDEMVIWLQIDPKTEIIRDIRWRTFGCGSAIAATSVMSEMVLEKGGMNLIRALAIKPADIMKRLGGLPARKVHCSVLGDKALEAAINDYFKKTGQRGKIITSGSKIIDKDLNIADRDVESAVLEGAKTFEDVQKILKVGIGDAESRAAVEELMRFYLEKYFK